jgi:transposase
MPWKECHVMDERLRFVARLLEGEKMAPLCAEFGISRKTGYKIFDRYKDCGAQAFSDRSHRAHRQANRLAAPIEATIVRLKREYPGWGAPKIREKLRQQFTGPQLPAISTVHAVLDRNGLVHHRRRRRGRAAGTALSRPQPNALWCADYKGEFLLGNRKYCYPLTITDFASRYLLTCEAQHIADHAPHPPLYFDYLDSDMANALAFTDGSYSFIGVTVPLVGIVSRVSAALSASDAVISSLDLPRETDREPVHAALFWMMLNFVVTHEYSHHVRGHIRRVEPSPVQEIRGGSLNGSVQRQAREADADGYSAYFSLAYWFDSLAGRQLVVQLLQIEHLPFEMQDRAAFGCFFAAVAGFTFLREPESLENDDAYRRTHPPQSLRLKLLSGFIMKWASEFRPALHAWMTEERYGAILDAVSSVVWRTSAYAAGWSAQTVFLRSPEGVAYADAVLAELNAFRATAG